MYNNLSNTGLSSATIGAISFWIGDMELGFGEKVGAGEKLLEEKKKKKKKLLEGWMSKWRICGRRRSIFYYLFF